MRKEELCWDFRSVSYQTRPVMKCWTTVKFITFLMLIT
jgi:hypothetical protein